MVADTIRAQVAARLRGNVYTLAALRALGALADEWRLPLALIDVGALELLAQAGLPGLPVLPPAVAMLAADLARSTPPRVEAPAGLGRTLYYGRWLRELFLHAYQGSEAPLVCLAVQLAALRALDQAPVASRTRARLAREAEAILMPLTELFGMWAARAELAERAQQILRPGRSVRFQRELEAMRPQREQLYERAVALLAPACQRAGLVVELHHRARSPASAFNRERAGEERERIFGTVKIDALAADEATLAAFRELAPTHLARLHAPGAPQPALSWQVQRRFNGYHVWVLAMPTGDPRAPLLRLRAFTPAMDTLNRLGLVAARFVGACAAPPEHAWWNAPIPHALLEPSDGKVAVFSRIGETVPLPDGATVLDFAYAARSDLLDHCARVWVNGEPAVLARRLAAGDLVAIETDRRVRGPLPAWEHAAFLPEHRRRLRRSVAQRADHAQQGRQDVADAITARCHAHALPVPGDHELQLFLAQVARRFNFVAVEALCVALSSPELRDPQLNPTVAQVAAQFVATRLGALISCADGTPLHRRYARLRVVGTDDSLGAAVRPGAPIVGRLRYPGTAHEELLICPAPAPGAPPPPPAVPLAWRTQRYQGASYVVTIDAVDRWGLLGDVLGLFYALGDSSVQLRQVVADVDHDPYARIALTITPDNPQQLDTIQARLSTLSPDERPRVRIEQAWQGELVAPFERMPFTTNPVSHPQLFLGREREVRRISRAVMGGASLVVIGGPSRIGKTSLLQWLANRELPEHQALPMQVQIGSCDFTPAGFWRAVLEAIRDSLRAHAAPGAPLPRVHLEGADPFDTTLRALAQITRALPRRRPVLLVDELTALHDHWDRQAADQVALQLGALLERLPAVSAILVVHDPLYATGQLTPQLARLLQRGQLLRLDHLDHEAARRLVVQPVEQLVAYDEPLVEALVRLTDGHPFLLQYTLMALHTRVEWGDRRQAVGADLAATLADVLREGRHVFRHHRELVPPPAAALACAVARLTQDRPACSLAELQAELRRLRRPAGRAVVVAQLATLRAVELLVPDQTAIQFRVPLFARWLASLADPAQL